MVQSLFVIWRFCLLPVFKMDEDWEDVPPIDEEPAANTIIVTEINKSVLADESYSPGAAKPKPLLSDRTYVSASMDCRIPSTIPVLTKFTTNPETYDIDRILDPKVQRSVESGHRFS